MYTNRSISSFFFFFFYSFIPSSFCSRWWEGAPDEASSRSKCSTICYDMISYEGVDRLGQIFLALFPFDFLFGSFFFSLPVVAITPQKIMN
jgi:hypothetical protein